MIRLVRDNIEEYLLEIENRNFSDYRQVESQVDEILANVQKYKDEAVKRYTREFDKVELDKMEVGSSEIQAAYNSFDKDLMETLKKAKENIYSYHSKQKRETYTYKSGENIILGQLINPVEKAGIYVPGGKAAYPSTVLMNAIPAKIAGVEEIVMVSPPQKDGKIKDSILVAADLAGVDRIFKVGGAQAIGALAYGTETIPKVYKITGPGNIYVTTAKRRLSNLVGIDMEAGPSEILILAEEGSNPAYIAADMLSQAEHDEMAASILITDSLALAESVKKELEEQVKNLDRKEIIYKSLKNYGAIILADSLRHGIDLVNAIAPEHLELFTANPFEDYKEIKNAGAIFLGEYSPEPVGDYFAGPNHTLPTKGTAKFASPLSVDDFIKKTSLIYYNRQALMESADDIIRFAEDEGFKAHANAINIRRDRK